MESHLCSITDIKWFKGWSGEQQKIEVSVIKNWSLYRKTLEQKSLAETQEVV